MGATLTVNPAKGETIEGAVKQLGMHSFDIGLEMSGSPKAFEGMIDNMYNGSKISLLGILPQETTVDWTKIIFKALTLKGIYGREMQETMVPDGTNVDFRYRPVSDHHPSHAHRRIQKGFEIMEGGQCGKRILSWD